MNLQAFTYHFLADLLSNLKAQGFGVGTRKYLKVQELIRRLPNDVPPKQLKSLLCPLFAKSPHEQNLFYELFDQSWKRTEELQQPSEKIEQQRKANYWKYAIVLLSILAAFYMGYWIKNYLYPPAEVVLPPPHYITFNVGLQDTAQHKVKLINDDTSQVKFIALCNGLMVDTDSIFGTYSVDSTGLFVYHAKNAVGQYVDTICVEILYPFGKYYNYFIPSIDSLKETSTTSKEASNIPSLTLLRPKALPYPFNIADWQINEQLAANINFYKKNAWWLKIGTIFILGLLFGAIIRWLQAGRRVLVAELQARDKAPYLWNIEIEGTEDKISFGNDYDLMLNQLRQRAPDERFALHIPQSIKATIQKGGMLAVKYRQQTRPPEYLMLIERPHTASHQTRLFNLLFENLKANEVFIERFYYRSDLRLVYNENFSNGIYLSELYARYPNSRLLIFGNGYQLLSPVTGKLAKWASFLQNWKERFLMTPQARSAWTNREKRIHQLLPIMPATISGLQLAIEQLDNEDETDFASWQHKIKDIILEKIEIKGDLIKTLEHYFVFKDGDGNIMDNRMLKWIAACAIYPSLHWDLTLYLGKLLSEEENSLLTYQNISRLCQLPWFIEGKIPEEVRTELLKYLSKEEETYLRRELYLLFGQLPKPPEDSVAFEDHQLSLAINEYLLTKNQNRKEDLETEVTKLLASGAEPDITVIKYLEHPQSSYDFKLPKIWKDYIDPSVKPSSPQEETKLEKALYFILGALTLFIIFFNPSFELCKGEEVLYQGLNLCLDAPEAKLAYWQQVAIDSIHAEKHEAVNRFVDSIKTLNNIQIFDTLGNKYVTVNPFFPNIATEYYNRGVLFYNQSELLLDSLSRMPVQDDALNQKAAVLLQKSCTHFDYAVEWDSSNLDFKTAIVSCKGEPISSSSNFEPISHPRFLWCLDNSHGRFTDAKMSPPFDDGTRLYEYQLTRDIVNRIIRKLEGLGVQYFNVMPLIDVDDALQQRVDAVNNYKTDLQKLYVGIHFNAGPAAKDNWTSPSINGIETWYQSNNLASKELAAVFQEKLIEKTAWRNRQIKFFTKGFKMLRDINCPGIQTENGFYNNQTQALELRKDAVREAIADAHVAAILAIEKNGLAALIEPSDNTSSSGKQQSTQQPPPQKEADQSKTQLETQLNKNQASSNQPIKLRPAPKTLSNRIEIFEVAARKGLRTEKGVIIQKTVYDNIEKDPATGFYRVQQNRRFGYLNAQGKGLIAVKYTYLGFSKDKLIRAEQNLWGYLNEKGNVVIDFQFENADDFNNGEAKVSQRIRNGKSYDTLIFYINTKGEKTRDAKESLK